MKLIYIHQYFTFPTTSGGTRSYDLATQFFKNGIDVTFITSSAVIKGIEINKRWTYVEREGLKFWILRNSYTQKMSISRRIIAFISFMFFASIKICSIKSDLVLATSTPLTIAVPALIKKMWSRTPFIFEVRDVWPEVPIKLGYIKNRFAISFLRAFEKFVYKQSAYVVPLSIGMKRDILSRIKVDKIEVIPNISEVNRFKNIDIKSKLDYDFTGKKVILYAGTFGPVNDLLYVAKLAERFAKVNPDVVFFMVGDGSQKEMIKNYCKDKGIYEKNIFFADPVSKNSLPYLYNISSLGSSFVSDNKILWDNSANKFFDTLAAGRPMLINHEGWQADLIREKKCGYVLPPIFLDEDIKLFNDYMMNNLQLNNQSENAQLAAEEFSLEVAVKKYLTIFNQIGNV